MVPEVFPKILLVVQFYVIEFLLISFFFFNHFTLAEELFAKALWSLGTCVLVNNNLCGKLFSSLESPATFDEEFKVTSVPIFIAGINLLSCELDDFTFNVLYWMILY